MYVVLEKMRDRRIILDKDGEHKNIIKFKPPLPFTKENADFFVILFIFYYDYFFIAPIIGRGFIRIRPYLMITIGHEIVYLNIIL